MNTTSAAITSEDDLDAVVATARSRAMQLRPLAQHFMEGDTKRPRYALGRNAQSAELARLGIIEGIADDFVALPATFEGLAVLRTSDLPVDAIIVSCSTSIGPTNALQALSRSGYSDVLEFHEVLAAANGRLVAPWFVTQQETSWETRRDDWHWLDSQLSDAESRKVLREVLAFRLTGRAEYTARHKVRMDEQYFEPFLECSNEVFVDAGGFDGDTADGFRCRYPDYRRIYLIEPSPENIALARTRLHGAREIVYCNVAISDVVGEMHFDAEAGSASALHANGGIRVQVSTIDALVKEPVTFIKMDLEGWETRALQGAMSHLRADRPKLAIAVYHAANDFLDIARLARSVHSDYRIFLRHYTQGWSETVMYFV